MCSYHTDILTSLKITAIKFKVTEKVVVHIYWKLIGYHNLTNGIFNNILFKSIADGTTYSNHNKHILEAGTKFQQSAIIKTKAVSISAATPSLP